MENPYTSPGTPSQFPINPINPHYSGWVQQVRVLSILTAVNGGMLLLAGLGFAGMAIFAVFYLVPEMQKQGNNPQMPTWILPAVYMGMGSGALISGVLQIIAGIKGNQFKGRKLFIASLIIGLSGLCTFYCAFTVVPLTIYGLIVMFNPTVQQAFRMREEGRTVPEILGYFGYHATPN